MTEERLPNGWEYGLCEGGYHGCAWAQRGNESDTWAHFSSLDEAHDYAERGVDPFVRADVSLSAPPGGSSGGDTL